MFSLHILLNWLPSPASHCHHGHHVTESNGLANPLDFGLRKVCEDSSQHPIVEDSQEVDADVHAGGLRESNENGMEATKSGNN